MWGHFPMMGWGWMPFFGVFPLLFLIFVAAGVVMLVRSVAGNRLGEPPSRWSGLNALDERYARGEIGREEYLQKKADITAGAPPMAGGAA